MKQEDIKYVYEIESSIDLDEIMEVVFDELGLESAKLQYFSLSKDDLIEKELSKENLIKEALEVNSNDEYPSIIFSNVEINVDDSRIEIISKIKLKLDGIDVDKIIKK